MLSTVYLGALMQEKYWQYATLSRTKAIQWVPYSEATLSNIPGINGHVT